MIRTELKTVPILAVSLELYDDKTDTARTEIKKNQWFTEEPGTYGAIPRGGRCLVVDEVDDSRRTLEYAVKTLRSTNEPSAIGVFVVHNKRKEKKGMLPANVEYFVGEEVDDAWVAYPWDAAKYKGSIREHERKADFCANRDNDTNVPGYILFILFVGMPVLYYTTKLVSPHGSSPPTIRKGWW